MGRNRSVGYWSLYCAWHLSALKKNDSLNHFFETDDSLRFWSFSEAPITSTIPYAVVTFGWWFLSSRHLNCLEVWNIWQNTHRICDACRETLSGFLCVRFSIKNMWKSDLIFMCYISVFWQSGDDRNKVNTGVVTAKRCWHWLQRGVSPYWLTVPTNRRTKRLSLSGSNTKSVQTYFQCKKGFTPKRQES